MTTHDSSKRRFKSKRAHSGWPPAPVQQLLQLAQKHFVARVNYNRLRLPPQEMLRSPRVEASKASHHELMQALDLWRNFGRRSRQLARAEELLRELPSSVH